MTSCHFFLLCFYMIMTSNMYFTEFMFYVTILHQCNNSTETNVIFIIKSPKHCLETYCFCSVSSSYYYYYYFFYYASSKFSPKHGGKTATFGRLSVTTSCYCLILLLLLLLLLLLFSFLSLRHERVHGRSQDLLDRIS